MSNYLKASELGEIKEIIKKLYSDAKGFSRISTETKFQTFIRPLTYKIYLKHGNETVAHIEMDDDWNMTCYPHDPFNIPYHFQSPAYDPMGQKMCELLVTDKMPPRCRNDIKKKYGTPEVDYGVLLYCTRGINLLDNYWWAWSEDDKAEDYHPRYNEEIMKMQEEYMLHLDPEPGEEKTPYINLDLTDEELKEAEKTRLILPKEYFYQPGEEIPDIEEDDGYEEFQSCYDDWNEIFNKKD